MSTGNPVPPPAASPPSLTWRAASGGAAAPPPGGPGGPPRPGKGLAITLLVLGVVGAGLGAYILQYATRFGAIRDDELLQSVGIGGAGIVLLALGLQRLLRGRAGWLAAAATLLVLGGAMAAMVVRAQGQGDAYRAGIAAQQALFERMKVVCDGGPGVDASAVPEAAAYDRAPGLHPAVFFTTYTDYETRGWAGRDPPMAWRAKSVEQVQLVVCATLTKDTLENCDYSVGASTRMLSRLRYVEEAVIYEARTRTELARTRIEGGEPPACPETMSFEEHETMKDWAGSYPSDAPILELARPWIEVGPGGPPSTGP
jgi:hypothetical protein